MLFINDSHTKKVVSVFAYIPKINILETNQLFISMTNTKQNGNENECIKVGLVKIALL